MKTKDNDSNNLAIKYLGRTLIIVVIGFIMYLLASIGYDTYVSLSQEKIEVRAQNSNSLN